MPDKTENPIPPQSSSIDETIVHKYILMKEENEKLQSENNALKKNLEKEELYHRNLYKQWNQLKAGIVDKDEELKQLKLKYSPKEKTYQYLFYGLLLITILLMAFNIYSFKSKGDNSDNSPVSTSQNNNDTSSATQSDSQKKLATTLNSTLPESKSLSKNQPSAKTVAAASVKSASNKYKVKVQSYFCDEPDINTRRKTFVLPWNDSYGILTALDDKNGFIYVVFINRAGRTSKGWINKKDLQPL